MSIAIRLTIGAIGALVIAVLMLVVAAVAVRDTLSGSGA
jgi:hypothetical protein